MRERSWTAHHEAAHSVASYRLCPDSDRGQTSIIPDEETLTFRALQWSFSRGLRSLTKESQARWRRSAALAPRAEARFV